MKEFKENVYKPVAVKDMETLEILVRAAYRESDNVAQASEKVMKVVKENLNKYCDYFLQSPLPHLTINRILEIKSNIK